MATGTGMQCLATCTLLSALFLRVVMMVWTLLRLEPEPEALPAAFLPPSLSLLFLFKIPVCPHSPLPLNSIWATAMRSVLQMAAGIFTMC